MKHLFPLTLGVVAMLAPLQAQVSRPKTFCNPLDLPYRFGLGGENPYREAADPTLVTHKGEFWLFASKSGGYWHSKDLLKWDFIVPNGFPTEEYAATVVVVGKQWLLLTSPSKSLYTTDDPATGKWTKLRDVDSVNDSALFLDDDGRLYLYSGSSPDKPIMGVELDTKNHFEPIGEPKPLIPVLDPLRHGWEGKIQLGNDEELRNEKFPPWLEGSWMTKHKGTYYLQYAAPATEMKVYGDGVYTSDKPLGEYRYAPYNPFSYKPTGFAASAGHSSTFQDRNGGYWRVCTMIVGVGHWFDRRLGIFPGGFFPNNNGPDQMACNTYLGDYPQLAPGIAKNPLSDNHAGWMLVSLKKPATVSSTLDEKHPVEKAFDEDMTTSWAAATGNAGEWIQVDLGKPCRIDAVQINFADTKATTHGRLEDSYRYQLEISDDNKTWKPLLDRKEGGRDAPHEYVQLEKPVTARFAKLTNVHMPAGAVFSVSGLRFFGSGLGKAPDMVASIKAERQDNRRLMKVTWDKSPGAEFYIVRYGIRPDRLTLNYQVYDGESVTLPGLNTDQEYFVTVDAINDTAVTKGTTVVPAKSL